MGPEPVEQVSAGLLVRGRRVLLAHRRPTRRWCPQTWDVPGGHRLPGESGGSALARELREELGVDVPTALTDAGPALRRREDGWQWDLWLVTAWRGQAVNAAPAEHDALAWVSVELVEVWDRAGRLAGPWVLDGVRLATSRLAPSTAAMPASATSAQTAPAGPAHTR